MNKGENKETIVRLAFGITGILCGFFCYAAYEQLPSRRGIIYILAAVLLMVLLMIIDRQRCSAKFIGKLNRITADIKRASGGSIPIEPEEDENEEVKYLYLAVERLRLYLKRKIRIQQAVLDLENTLAVNIKLDNLIEVLLPRLIEETNSNWGVFYLYNKITDRLELKNSIGLSKNVYREFDVEIGEGLIGIAAKMKKVFIQKDIPRDTIFENRTFLGKVLPKNIMTVPIYDKEELMAVIAFASIYEYNEEQLSVIELIRNYLGFSVTNCVTYERTQRLTKELQFQNELIQNMNDELEKKVAERTDFLNGVINGIKDYIIISVDKDGYITTWNEGAEQIRGYQAEEAIGRYIGSVYEDVEERELVEKQLDIALHEGQYRELGWRKRRDGTRFYLDTYITPMYNNTGDLQGFTNISKDITVLQLLEEDLIFERACNQKILEKSGKALLYTDREGIICNASMVCAVLLGTGEADIRGKCFYDFFVESEKAEKTLVNSCSTSGKGSFHGELIYKHGGLEALTVEAVALTASHEDALLGILVELWN